MKPVMYLDVDGVLWIVIDPESGKLWTPESGYAAAPCLAGFMEYALEHFEVRWCTAWATSGDMRDDGRKLLAEWTGVPVETWAQVRPSLGWTEYKTECIDWAEVEAGRPFVWIEDGLLSRELDVLRGRRILDWYFHTDVLDDPQALCKTLAKLKGFA